MPRGPSFTRRPCPLCSSRRARRRWHEDGLDYVRCVDCGCFFTDIEEDLYERLRHNVWDEKAPTSEALEFYGAARAAAHRAFLGRCCPFGRGRLLDVGCGLGFFLDRARASGWDVRGCEPSPSWSDQAEQRVGPDRIIRGRIDDPALDGSKFDLVTAWDVLEHIFEPVVFLRRVHDILAPGGRVFLRTPNLAYVLPLYRARRRLGQDVRLGPTNHVVYFDARTIRRAMREAGLAPERWLALPPPQVALRGGAPMYYASRRSIRLGVKNVWARAMDSAARATSGGVVLASDLDILARRPLDW